MIPLVDFNAIPTSNFYLFRLLWSIPIIMYTFRAMNIARDLVIGMEVFTCLAQNQWNEH